MSQSPMAPPGGEGVEPVRPLYAADVAGSDSSPAIPEKAITIAGYVLLAVVVSCVALMSWTGLVGFGRTTLHMSAPLVWLVPISLDVAAMTCAFLSLRSTVAGDSATGPRLLVLAFVAASAVFNWIHAGASGGGAPAEVFYAGMSLAAATLFDVVLRQVRRHLLRRMRAIERPLPRFRAVRWLRYPAQTYAAWSVAVRDGLTRPDEALAALATVGTPPDAPLALETATKTDALLIAFGAVGGLDVPAALAWLSRQGVTVDRSHAYAVARPLRPAEVPAQLTSGDDSA